MKPTKLHLRGAKGIKAGLGLDEITLDLSDMAGLVVLDGDNGRGKTTILDNLHPYRMLPSRKKQSLQHHFFLPDSFREITQADAAGNTWRFLIKVDGVKGKQEAYIYQNGNTESLTGSLGEYDAKVAELMGSPDMFLSSAFSAQRQDDGQMTVGQLRNQLAEYLNLHEHQERSETCKGCASTLLDRQKAHTRRMEEIRELMFPLSSAPIDLEANDKAMENLNNSIDEARKRLERLKATSSSLAEKKVANEGMKSKLTEMENQISKMEEDLQQAIELRDRELAAHDATVKKSDDLCESLETALSEKPMVENAAKTIRVLKESKALREREQSEIQQKIRAIRTHIDTEQEKIESLWDQLAIIDAECKAAIQDNEVAEKATIDNLNAQLDALSGAGDQLAERSDAWAANISFDTRLLEALDSDMELKEIEFNLKVAIEAAEGLEKAIDPACVSTVCGLSKNAIESRDRIPGLQSELSQRKALIDSKKHKLSESIAASSGYIDEINTKREEIQAGAEKLVATIASETERFSSEAVSIEARFRDRRNDKVAEKAQIEYRVKLLKNELSTKETALEDCAKTIETINRQIAENETLAARKEQMAADEAKLELAAARRSELIEERKNISSRHDAAIAATREKLINARAAAGAIEIDDNIDNEIQAVSELITDTEGRVSRLEGDLTELRTKSAYLKKDIEQLEKLSADNEAIQNQINNLRQESAEWKYLENALGPNGLQALEIEFATPVICAVANDLLADSFNGTGMQVKMKTQTDSGKETLQIWAIRPDGTEVFIENLSGGERVWLLKSMRLSRLIMAKENSGFDYLAALGDEEDGALRHGETSENFIGLYKAFRKRAGFHVCYYISHKKECIAMADRVIRVHRAGDPDGSTFGGVFETTGITIE